MIFYRKILQWIRSHVNKEESENEPTFNVAEDIDKKLQQYSGPCNCSELVMSSDNPVTLRKHGESMGQFSLVGGMAGRPVYRHKQSQDYLFYQPKIEGWLVNDRPGTLYGRIQLQSTKVIVHLIPLWKIEKMILNVARMIPSVRI